MSTTPITSILVANRSTTALSVTVTPRPWLQSAAGKVSPNRKAKLAGITVDHSASAATRARPCVSRVIMVIAATGAAPVIVAFWVALISPVELAVTATVPALVSP